MGCFAIELKQEIETSTMPSQAAVVALNFIFREYRRSICAVLEGQFHALTGPGEGLRLSAELQQKKQSEAKLL
jgi:hypothetical protein